MTTEPAATPAPRSGDPFSPGIQRLAASSGLGFVLLMILSVAFQGGDMPEYGDNVSVFASYAREHAEDQQRSTLFLLLACFELLWFVGYLRGQLGRAEEAARGFTRISHIVFAGGIVAAVGLILSGALTAASVSQPEDTSAEIVRALYILSYYPFLLASVGLAVMLYTAGFFLLRVRVLPRWLGAVGIVGGLAWIVTLFSVLDEGNDGGVEVFYPIGLCALVVFAVAASIVFLREVGRAPTE
jgi:hypothetical protein